MTFLRLKKINNNFYCYLVQNRHTKHGPRQKVKKYLGKAIKIEKKQDLDFQPPDKTNKTQLLRSLVIWELKKHNFRLKNNLYQNKNITYSPKTHQTLKNKKEILLSLNQGFLCPFTLKRLLNFKKTNNFQQDAHLLAKYFIEAGINIPREVFIEFYQKI